MLNLLTTLNLQDLANFHDSSMHAFVIHFAEMPLFLLGKQTNRTCTFLLFISLCVGLS